jgi:hypothetical protein
MLFTDDLLEWKRDIWFLFNTTVIHADFNNLDILKNIIQEYSQPERIKIFKPVTDILSYEKRYKINVLDNSFALKGILLPFHDLVKAKLLF